MEAKSEAKLEAKLGAKLEAKSEAKLEAKAEAKLEAEVEATLEAKAEAKLEAKVEATLEAKAEAKLEAKVEATLEAKVEAKSETTAEGDHGGRAAAARSDTSSKQEGAKAEPIKQANRPNKEKPASSNAPAITPAKGNHAVGGKAREGKAPGAFKMREVKRTREEAKQAELQAIAVRPACASCHCLALAPLLAVQRASPLALSACHPAPLFTHWPESLIAYRPSPTHLLPPPPVLILGCRLVCPASVSVVPLFTLHMRTLRTLWNPLPTPIPPSLPLV